MQASLNHGSVSNIVSKVCEYPYHSLFGEKGPSTVVSTVVSLGLALYPEDGLVVCPILFISYQVQPYS